MFVSVLSTKCSCCEYTESHSFENLLPTFPELVDNFSISFLAFPQEKVPRVWKLRGCSDHGV
ncbi:hypothetical protein DPMN_068824 [Dreissena polymorpha]|uniref:Uncharacterized protein n=1 Tax=Dreissena polymorpha TaxID=45954 RepID=A0A9D3Z2Z0_DREPO|nr:hypothetical protein DPMN_068824 [Dreissena polymorpha]